MKQITNYFTSYELTEADQKQGAQLSTLTVAVLHNLRSTAAQDKINLVFTPNDTLSFLQQEAYLKGQIDLLTYILDSNEDSQQFHHINTTKE